MEKTEFPSGNNDKRKNKTPRTPGGFESFTSKSIEDFLEPAVECDVRDPNKEESVFSRVEDFFKNFFKKIELVEKSLDRDELLRLEALLDDFREGSPRLPLSNEESEKLNELFDDAKSRLVEARRRGQSQGQSQIDLTPQSPRKEVSRSQNLSQRDIDAYSDVLQAIEDKLKESAESALSYTPVLGYNSKTYLTGLISYLKRHGLNPQEQILFERAKSVLKKLDERVTEKKSQPSIETKLNSDISSEHATSDFKELLAKLLYNIGLLENIKLTPQSVADIELQILSEETNRQLKEKAPSLAEYERIKKELDARIKLIKQFRTLFSILGSSPAKIDSRYPQLTNTDASIGNFNTIFNEAPLLNGGEKEAKQVLLVNRKGELEPRDVSLSWVGKTCRRLDRALGGEQPLLTQRKGDFEADAIDQIGVDVILNSTNMDSDYMSLAPIIAKEDEFRGAPENAIFTGIMFYFYIIQGQAWRSPTSDEGISSDFQRVYKFMSYQSKYVAKGQASFLLYNPMILADYADSKGNSLANEHMINLRAKYTKLIPKKYTSGGSSGKYNYDKWLAGPRTMLIPERSPAPVRKSDGSEKKDDDGKTIYSRLSKNLFPTFLDYLQVGTYEPDDPGDLKDPKKPRIMRAMDYVFVDPSHPEHGEQVYYEGVFKEVDGKPGYGSYEHYNKVLANDVWGFVGGVLYAEHDDLINKMKSNAFYADFTKNIGYCWPFFGCFRDSKIETDADRRTIRVEMHKFRVSFWAFALRYAVLRATITSNEAKDIINNASEKMIQPNVGDEALKGEEPFFTRADVRVILAVVQAPLWELGKQLSTNIVAALEKAGS